jgi:hypothetical protein
VRVSFEFFMRGPLNRYVTGGYVSMPESGDRLAQVIAAPECAKSNVYWSWNGGAKTVCAWRPSFCSYMCHGSVFDISRFRNNA